MHALEGRWAQFWRRYEAGRWEPETRALVASVLRPGDLFVDVGAWIGPVTLWALERGAHVIAIEPDPVAVRELRRRVPDEVEVVAAALTPEGGSVRLGAKHQYGDSMARVDGEGISVRGVTLGSVLGGRTPKLVTIDVEGYEMVLLPGVAPYLAALGSTLQVELHTALPDPEWFAGYSRVEMPPAPRDPRGRPNHLLAAP